MTDRFCSILLPTVMEVAFVVLCFDPSRGEVKRECKINNAYSVASSMGLC
jgi:hypothetical protein